MSRLRGNYSRKVAGADTQPHDPADRLRRPRQQPLRGHQPTPRPGGGRPASPTSSSTSTASRSWSSRPRARSTRRQNFLRRHRPGPLGRGRGAPPLPLQPVQPSPPTTSPSSTGRREHRPSTGFRWPDPWPRSANEFATPTELGLWALLDRRRLLDLLAHFHRLRDTRRQDGQEGLPLPTAPGG